MSIKLILGLLAFFCLLRCLGCFSFEPTAIEERYYEKERHKIFLKERFDPEVVNRTDQYVKLIDFFQKNLDEIVSSYSKYDKDSMFHEVMDRGYIRLPESLQPKYLQLTEGFPEATFRFYHLFNRKPYFPDATKGQVLISLDNHEPEPTAADPLTLHIEKRHYLIFNDDSPTPVDTCTDKMCLLIKDTLLSKNLRYVIVVGRNNGW